MGTSDEIDVMRIAIDETTLPKTRIPIMIKVEEVSYAAMTAKKSTKKCDA